MKRPRRPLVRGINPTMAFAAQIQLYAALDRAHAMGYRGGK
ncbi:MAG: hypothetical protein ACLPID_02715 [Beijerinckiaceae bacterium]